MLSKNTVVDKNGHFEVLLICLILIFVGFLPAGHAGASFTFEQARVAGVKKCQKIFVGTPAALKPPNTAPTLVSNINMWEAQNNLGRQGLFLRQNDCYLDEQHIGGTCASVTIVNILMTLHEAHYNGTFKRQSPFSMRKVKKLHKWSLEKIEEVVKTESSLARDGHIRNGLSPVIGKHLGDLYEQIYNQSLETNVYSHELDPHLLSEIDFTRDLGFAVIADENNLSREGHMVQIIGVEPIREPSSLALFYVFVRDPHRPNIPYKLTASEGVFGEIVYLTSAENNRSGFAESAILYLSSTFVLNFTKEKEAKVDSLEAQYKSLFEKGGEKVKEGVSIGLKSGYKIRTEYIYHKHEDTPEGYFELSTKHGGRFYLPFSSLAFIAP